MKILRAVSLVALLLPFASAQAAAPKTMVFQFYFDNTSPEATRDDETARIKKITDELRADLQSSGKYDVVPATEKPLTAIPDFSKCTSEQVDQAQKAGAELVACGWVQKVSNLILNLNLVIEETKTGKPLAGGSVDIRGNTDVSWDRGLKYLLDEHVFAAH
jgi:hypothetical protein